MRHLSWAAAATAAVLGLAVGVQAADIYVSPGGDDANAGTKDKPVKTLEHARDLVRGMNQNMAADVVVHLADGTYQLSATLEFSARDSGTNGHDVIYRADDGLKAIVSGGVPVTGWKQAEYNKLIWWSAPAPAGLTNTRQLYVDGVRAQRARGLLPATLRKTASGYTASNDVMSHWRNPSDIEFVYTGGNALWGAPSEGLGAWTEPRCPVATIDGTDITMAEPCWDNSTKRVMLKQPLLAKFNRTANLVGPASVGREPAYVENAFELLTEPGQWYFDRPAKTIYYIPRPGENLATADVEVPVLEKLIDGKGTAAAPVQNIRFEGIQFSYATWLYPSSPEGFSEIQANFMVTGPDGYATQGLGDLADGGKQPFGDWTPTPGNVAFAYDHHIQFVRDAFVHLGAAGLSLGDGSQNDAVQGCVFTDISSNGLALGGVDKPMASGTDATSDNVIADNHLYDLPVEYHGGVAIDIGYTQRTHIEHNQLDHLAYSGISLGWGGWPDKIEQPGIPNTSQNVVVSDNLIFEHLLLLADGGGIYTQGLTGPSLADGEKVTGNVVRDQFGSGHAIYSDNGSANMTITGNVMFRTNFDNWGSAHKDYYDGGNGSKVDPFLVADNFWQQGTPDSASRNNLTYRANHLISKLEDVPADVVANAGLQGDFKDILAERFVKSAAPEPPSRVGAVGGDGFAYVAWNPPVFEGSSPVVSYTVFSSTGQSATITAEQFTRDGFAKITSLPNGTACHFTVVANNQAGASSPGICYAVVTPGPATVRPPNAPVLGTIELADGRASVHFQAPANDGGAPVIAYTFTVTPGDQKVTISGRSAITLGGGHTMFYVLDGFEKGKSYTISVSASNVAGDGATVSKQVNP